jgi:hypothetical protein
MDVSHSCFPLINPCILYQVPFEETGSVITINYKSINEPEDAIKKGDINKSEKIRRLIRQSKIIPCIKDNR